MTPESEHGLLLRFGSTCRFFSALVVICCFLFSACTLLDKFQIPRFPRVFENEPEEGTSFIGYILECKVNGEALSEMVLFDYSRFEYRRSRYEMLFLPEFTGLIYDYDNSINGYRFKGNIDFSNFSFNLQWTGDWRGQPPYPLDSGEHRVYNPLNIHIKSDGHSPFKAGVEYSSLDCFALYYPADFVNQKLGAHGPETDFLGVEVTLLSSWFKFGYRKMEDPGLGIEVDVLDFYFDFVEVVEKLPDGFIAPAVGDTIRVNGGHFTQPLFMHDIEMVHKLIVP